MLSREQLWRRLKPRRSNSKERLRHQAEYEVFVARAAEEQKNAGKVQPNRSPRLLLAPPTDFSELKIKSIPGRKVRFSPVIRVCLVHCRADLLDDFEQLFWVRDDYQTFKEDALRELRAHWLKNRTTVKEAINDLYQPSPEESAYSQTLFLHKDSVAQLKSLSDVEQGLFGGIDFGADTTVQSPQGSTSSTDSTQEYGEERKQQQGMEERPTTSPFSEQSALTSTPNIRTTSTNSASEDLRFKSEEQSNGGLLCNIAHGGMDLITPLKGDTSRHSTVGNLNTSSHASGASSKPPNGILKNSFTRPVSSTTAADKAATTGITISIPTPSAPPSSRDSREHRNGGNAGNSGSEGVRVLLVEESPCSSVSSFEPPILTC